MQRVGHILQLVLLLSPLIVVVVVVVVVAAAAAAALAIHILIYNFFQFTHIT